MKKAYFVKTSEKQNPNIIKHPNTNSIRLNKFIADAGFSSRRGADKLIAQGLVTIDGIKATIGTRVYNNQIVKLNNQIVSHNNKLVYLVVNKPRGIISTTDTTIKENLVDFINFTIPIFPIGRLDKDSSGLLFLTNDGDLVNKILRVEYGHEKEYEVTVDHKITTTFIKQMEQGVKIYNLVANKYQTTKPCVVTKINDHTFRIILKEGLNRQIRRMTAALGYNVNTLVRIRIMNVTINNLKDGQYRLLTNKELIKINEAINKFEY